jgi:hypothetical protein
MPQRKRKSTPPTPTPPTDDQVRHALAVIAKAPPAVFIAEHPLRARFSAAIALVAQAVVILDEVRASGEQDALETEGRLGDADLTGHAWEAADDLRSLLPRWSSMLNDWHETRDVHVSAFRTALADSDSTSIAHYLAVAVAIEAEWPDHLRQRVDSAPKVKP